MKRSIVERLHRIGCGDSFMSKVSNAKISLPMTKHDFQVIDK